MSRIALPNQIAAASQVLSQQQELIAWQAVISTAREIYSPLAAEHVSECARSGQEVGIEWLRTLAKLSHQAALIQMETFGVKQKASA